MTTPEELDILLSNSLDRMQQFHSRGLRSMAVTEAGILMSRLIERYPESLGPLGHQLAGPLHRHHGLCYVCGNETAGGEVCASCQLEEQAWGPSRLGTAGTSA